MSDPSKRKDYIFSTETINALIALGNVLERIYRRMKSEGYDIIDGRIIHLETGKEYEPNHNRKRAYIKRNRER